MSTSQTQDESQTSHTFYDNATLGIGKKISTKTVSVYCRTGGVLVLAESNRNSSKNLVSKSQGKSKATARGRNWEIQVGNEAHTVTTKCSYCATFVRYYTKYVHDRLFADSSPWFALACALYATRPVILCWFELSHNASSRTTTGIWTNVCAYSSSYSWLKPFRLSIMGRRRKAFGKKGVVTMNVCHQVIATTAVMLPWCQNRHNSVSFYS